jgi:hypothetical protein
MMLYPAIDYAIINAIVFNKKLLIANCSTAKIHRMSTMSFSVEDDIKRDFATWAKRAKKSKSDLFRDMVAIYRFNNGS